MIISLGSRIFLASTNLLMLIETGGMCLALSAHSPKAFTSLNLSPRSNFSFNSSLLIRFIDDLESFINCQVNQYYGYIKYFFDGLGSLLICV
jgi:hypothetical protein